MQENWLQSWLASLCPSLAKEPLLQSPGSYTRKYGCWNFPNDVCLTQKKLLSHRTWCFPQIEFEAFPSFLHRWSSQMAYPCHLTSSGSSVFTFTWKRLSGHVYKVVFSFLPQQSLIFLRDTCGNHLFLLFLCFFTHKHIPEGLPIGKQGKGTEKSHLHRWLYNIISGSEVGILINQCFV